MGTDKMSGEFSDALDPMLVFASKASVRLSDCFWEYVGHLHSCTLKQSPMKLGWIGTRLASPAMLM